MILPGVILEYRTRNKLNTTRFAPEPRKEREGKENERKGNKERKEDRDRVG